MNYNYNLVNYFYQLINQMFFLCFYLNIHIYHLLHQYKQLFLYQLFHFHIFQDIVVLSCLIINQNMEHSFHYLFHDFHHSNILLFEQMQIHLSMLWYKHCNLLVFVDISHMLHLLSPIHYQHYYLIFPISLFLYHFYKYCYNHSNLLLDLYMCRIHSLLN